MKKKIGVFGVLFVLTLMTIGVVSASTSTIRPNAQGYYSGWTNSGCSSGSSEWQCVDENPANTTDNLYTSAKNTYESFAFQDTGFTTETINSVTLYFYGQRYSSTRYRFQPLIRASSTNYLGPLKSLTSSYAYYTETYTTNPATGSPWTIAEVNALEAGMKSYSASYGGRIAQVYAVVDYSVPDSCSDTDGGNIISVFGTASGYLNSTPYSSDDYCVDTSNIMEYYCSGAYNQSQQQSCGTDGYVGSNYCMSGDVYGNYTDYSCGSGACSSNTSVILQQDCVTGQYCSSGQCLWSDSCSDTDGGYVLTVFGNVTGFLNQSYYGYSDYCIDNTTIMEYYCSGSYSNSWSSSCAGNLTTICTNGRCI
jgi:hypothetical protein